MINTPAPRLRNSPIVEAVFDVDCDLPPGFDLAAMEELARSRFRDRYPKFRARFLQESSIEAKAGVSRLAPQALQFLHEDERQFVQMRDHGFSFNRLAPYSGLADYLPEIERTWRLYLDLAAPVPIRFIRLRYINRILVPMTATTVDLDEFLTISPRLPHEEKLVASGFLIQQAAIEEDTGLQVYLVLTGPGQAPVNGYMPVILDIAVAGTANAEPADWPAMQRLIASLRRLKNRVFLDSLTPKCIALFQ